MPIRRKRISGRARRKQFRDKSRGGQLACRSVLTLMAGLVHNVFERPTAKVRKAQFAQSAF